jgi:hypothetical protein
MLVNLLESLAYASLAFISALASVTTELVLSRVVLTQGAPPGTALIAGALVGIAVALPPLLRLLLHPGRVLATSLWIQ